MGNYGMIYMHGKWMCGYCQDKEKKRAIPKVTFTVVDDPIPNKSKEVYNEQVC